jgi:hypothetical protein
VYVYKGRILLPNCVPEKVGVNKKCYSLKRLEIIENKLATERETENERA